MHQIHTYQSIRIYIYIYTRLRVQLGGSELELARVGVENGPESLRKECDSISV